MLKKNIKKICDFPLIAYSIVACKMCKNIDRVIVSTDDPEIAEIASKYGAEIPFLRPRELARDSSTDLEVIRHLLNNIDVPEIAYIRPTTPLRDPVYMDFYIEEYYRNREEITSIRSMHELAESPYKFLQIKDGSCYGFFSDFKGIKDYTNLPRQIFPKAYHPNGYIDIIKKKTIEEGSTYGEKVFPVVTDFVTEIDTVNQLKYLEYEMNNTSNSILNELRKRN